MAAKKRPFSGQKMVSKHKQKNKLLQKDIDNKKIIEQQAAELKRVDALKSKLFANISHELRTPLTLISAPILVGIFTPVSPIRK